MKLADAEKSDYVEKDSQILIDQRHQEFLET